jgi:hypothetical protein
VDPMLLGTAAAFGLAASAGLNTTLPLLIVGLLARAGLLGLAAPYDALASDTALGGLIVLAVLEFIGDKVPGWDSAVQAIQLPLAAAAGGILFASQTAAVNWVSPEVAILVGLLTAGTVHGAREAVRPMVSGMTFGLGNGPVSLAEDAAALLLVVASLLAPALAAVLAAFLVMAAAYAGVRLVRRGARLARRRSQPMRHTGRGARATCLESTFSDRHSSCSGVSYSGRRPASPGSAAVLVVGQQHRRAEERQAGRDIRPSPARPLPDRP